MKKLLSLILLTLFAATAFADPNGGCNFKTGTPACVAFSGKTLTLATQGAQNLIFKTNDVTRGYFSGSTGALTGVTLSGATISDALTLSSVQSTTSPFTISPGSDANRLFSFGASSDTAHTLTFGDAGVTASQTWFIGPSTPDGDDDSVTTVGAQDNARGARTEYRGNEATSGGQLQLQAGDESTGSIYLDTPNASGTVNIRSGGQLQRWGFNASGDLVADATNGGNFIMSKAATGLILGKATVAADVGTTPAGYIFAPATTQQLILAQGTADTNGVLFDIVKSRATDGSADTIVTSSDTVGTIRFRASDGANFITGAAIQAFIAATPGSNDMPTSLAFQTVPDGSGALATVLSLSSEKVATFSGTVLSSRTTDIGWSIVSGANTACNTTCTSACVMGQETTSKAFLACTDATADVCLCAGAS